MSRIFLNHLETQYTSLSERKVKNPEVSLVSHVAGVMVNVLSWRQGTSIEHWNGKDLGNYHFTNKKIKT